MIESLEDYDYRPALSENINLPGGEFSIYIYNEDITTQPHKSRLIINGRVSVTVNVTDADGKIERKVKSPLDKNSITMVNNGVLSIFDRIDYYIGDCKIDSVRKPFFCTSMKGLVSFERDLKYHDGGWKICLPDSSVINSEGYFSLNIHLSTVMGFFEDYSKFLYRIPQKLVFHRSVGSDSNVFLTPNSDDSVYLRITEILWRMPQVKFSMEYESRVRKDILSGKSFELKYRHWLYQSIPIPHGTEFSWEIPTSYSKTKYVLLAFQLKDREAKSNKDYSLYDLLDLENVQVLLNNNVYYPRERLNLKFSENKCGRLYHMYKTFKASYYGKEESEADPLLDYNKFLEKYPIIAIDCSYQPALIKESLINLKILFSWRKEIEENSAVIHAVMIMDDKAVYNPLRNTVLHN